MDEQKPKHPGGRPPKFKTPEEMQEKIDGFFESIDGTKKKPTITGLCLFIDLERQNLLEYEKKPEFRDTIKKARKRIMNAAEQELFRGSGQVAGIIFYLKNNFPEHYKDTIDQNVSINTIKIKRTGRDGSN